MIFIYLGGGRSQLLTLLGLAVTIILNSGFLSTPSEPAVVRIWMAHTLRRCTRLLAPTDRGHSRATGYMGLHETSSKKSLAGRLSVFSGDAQSKPNMGDAVAGFVGIWYNQGVPQY